MTSPVASATSPTAVSIYHVHAKSIYRAIEQEDNRNRRVAQPALIARKLMLLDLVISTPGVEWFATEQDKVALFTIRFGIRKPELPLREYEAAKPGLSATTRAFIHNLPIYLEGDPARPHFVCAADGVGEGRCEAFLRDHARLLNALPAWTLVVVGPQHTADFNSSERAFQRFRGQTDPMFPGFDTPDLRWYCETRSAVERSQFDRLSVPDIARFRDLRRRVATPLVDALYQERLQWDGASQLGNEYSERHRDRSERQYPHQHI